MIHKQLPSQDRIGQLLSYDSRTGELYWKITQSNVIRSGSKAGSLNNANGYVRIKLDKIMYAAHRLVWKMHTGKDPAHHLDHINGIRSDNRIENLREATNSQNIAAAKLNKISKSGKTGVYYIERLGKYTAAFRKNRKYNYLGLFGTLQEAEAAYLKAFKESFGEYARKTNGEF